MADAIALKQAAVMVAAHNLIGFVESLSVDEKNILDALGVWRPLTILGLHLDDLSHAQVGRFFLNLEQAPASQEDAHG